MRKRIKTGTERRKKVALVPNSPPKLGGVPERSEGGVVPEPQYLVLRNHPVCARFGGFAPFLEGAATPPNLGGELGHSTASSRLGSLVFPLLLLLPACRQEMADQPRYRPLQESTFFADHRSARPLPIGVVARGFLNDDEHLFTGRQNGELAAAFPFEITPDVLERGRERYGIFCTPCHDHVGTGNGMAVRRGFRRGPPSFHLDRLREAPVGHFYDVISNGFGAMNDYAAQIKPRDRWAIVAYIRALQLSQNVRAQDLPAEDRQALERLPR